MSNLCYSFSTKKNTRGKNISIISFKRKIKVYKILQKVYKHTGDKPYQCQICVIHSIQKKTHGEKTYQSFHLKEK